MFVVVEGPNGGGKTTLINNMKDDGYNTLSSPNGTPLAKMIRSACRGTEPWEDIDKVVQFLLFSAARMDEYIRCVHDKDEIVVADRWWTSTYVYQCVLQGIAVDALEHTIHPDEKIDLVILLDAPNEVLLDRVTSEREKNESHGKCTWTKDNEIMFRLMDIYRNELPEYLASKGIKVVTIDTENVDAEHVFNTTKDIIDLYKSID